MVRGPFVYPLLHAYHFQNYPSLLPRVRSSSDILKELKNYMDSGNSGSIQSSSGGDDEYDSGAADTSFINPSTNPIFNPLSRSNPSPMFDPLSNFFDPPVSSRPQNQNLGMVWSKPHPNSTDQINPFFNQISFPQITENVPAARGGGVLAPSSSSANKNAPAEQTQTRNPKKRSRASRRAPTTVLTTDTANFRAMVQEFTGIPAPPFASSSPFTRSRLDLFGTPSSIRSNLNISQPLSFHNHNHNLLRPFAQKVQPTFSPVFSNSITTSTTSSNLPSQLGLSNQQPPRGNSSNLLNNMQMQNPNLTFQSFLQTPSPKYPLPNSSLIGSKSLENSSNDSHLKMGFLDEFGLSHGQVNNARVSGLPSLISSDNGDGNDYNFSQNVTNGKVNYSAASSSSNFQGPGNSVSATRGEGNGIMESWICSSD